MDRINEAQNPQEPAVRTWGENECCFACASLTMILSLMSGALFAYEFSVTQNVYYFIALVCSSSLLPASLYSAVYFARKEHNPRAVRPTGLVDADQRRDRGLNLMRVVRPQNVPEGDVVVESAQSSKSLIQASAVPGPPLLLLPMLFVSGVDLRPLQEAAEGKSSVKTASEKLHHIVVKTNLVLSYL